MTNWLASLIEKASSQRDISRHLINSHAPVFIYGTGTFAQDIYRVLVNNGFSVYGFIDHLKSDTTFLHGMPIYTPEIAAEINGAEKALIVLGIHNYLADTSKIATHLKKIGFKKVLTSIDLYDVFNHELGTRYWLTSRDYYFSLSEVLEETHSLLEDEISKSLFRSILEFRLVGDVTKLPAPDLINPYHPINLPPFETALRFIDCGAFDGDTIRDFINNDISIQEVAAFEPDLTNYTKLSRFVSEHKKDLPKATLFPCGVFSSTRQLEFETGQGMASKISDNGMTVIQCVALDDAIPTFSPNFIKMDIEGAEYDALLGARQLISHHNPRIATSLYHTPEHLWQLLLLIERIAHSKYAYYIRSHALNDFELVLYAIPKVQSI